MMMNNIHVIIRIIRNFKSRPNNGYHLYRWTLLLRHLIHNAVKVTAYHCSSTVAACSMIVLYAFSTFACPVCTFCVYFLCAGVVADVRGDDRATIYADGKQVGSTRHWAEVWSGLIPTTTRVVAVYVNNTNAKGFLVASFSNGFKTNEEWKSSETNTSGWTDVDFNDAEWPAAIRRTDDPAGIHTDPFLGRCCTHMDHGWWIWNRRQVFSGKDWLVFHYVYILLSRIW